MSDHNEKNDTQPQDGKTQAYGNPGVVSDNEIDLLEILRTHILPHWIKYFVAAFLGAFLLASASYKVTPKYQASVTALINVSSSSSRLMMKGGLSSLATLAGMNINTGDSDYMFNINFIKSRELADAFSDKYNFRHEFFYKQYDENGVFKGEKRTKALYTKLFGGNYAEIGDDDIFLTPGPTKEAVYKKFNRVFSIDIDQKSMTVTISATWKDPIKVKRWANDYMQMANDILKKKAISESNLKIQYLESQIRENPSLEVQQAIYALIESEMKQIAIAESSDEFAFKITQRAFLPEHRASPNRWRFLFSGAFLGAFIMFVYLMLPTFKASLRNKN